MATSGASPTWPCSQVMSPLAAPEQVAFRDGMNQESAWAAMKREASVAAQVSFILTDGVWMGLLECSEDCLAVGLGALSDCSDICDGWTGTMELLIGLESIVSLNTINIIPAKITSSLCRVDS